jgi:hypothetical protein
MLLLSIESDCDLLFPHNILLPNLPFDVIEDALGLVPALLGSSKLPLDAMEAEV